MYQQQLVLAACSHEPFDDDDDDANRFVSFDSNSTDIIPDLLFH